MAPAEWIGLIAWISIFLMSVVIHEVSHGVIAYALGDSTAKQAGRLTLNPFKHLDPVWTLLVPAFLYVATQGKFAIGMAKPVPVNFSQLQEPRRDMIWVALAGPFSNLVLASVLNILFKMTEFSILLYAIYFNLGLAVFNLIPIPPLDGSKMLAGLLPWTWSRPYLRIEPWGYLVILGLYFSGILLSWMIPGINLFCSWMDLPKLAIHF